MVKQSLENNEEENDIISLNDLVMCRNIIHVASKRGAFSAEEFSDIGGVIIN